MDNLLQIKTKHTEILSLLYRFRFLTRKQIQAMLNHKYPSRIFSWLDELKDDDYLNYTYTKNFDNLPAIYSLGKNGVKHLRKIGIISGKADRVRKEQKCSNNFRELCLIIGDIYLSLLKLPEAKIHFYTKTDLSGMEHLISPHPDAYFAIDSKSGIKRYFLEIFSENLRSNILRHRVKAYLTYYESDDWQDNTDKPFPEIILVCPNTKAKNHLYYYISQKLDEDDHPNVYLTTKEAILASGLTKGVLEKIQPKE